MAIVVVLGHDLDTVRKYVTRLGFDFEPWHLNPHKNNEGKKGVVYGFNSVNELVKAKVYKTPILFESGAVASMVALNTKSIFVDAKVLQDGLIVFTDIDKLKLKKALAEDYDPDSASVIVFRRNRILQYGITSKIAEHVNAFLSTIPAFSHVPTLVSFVNAMEGDWGDFEAFLDENRLMTNQNKKHIKALGERIKEIELPLQALVTGDKKAFTKAMRDLSKKDTAAKACMQRIRFYRNFYGKKKLGSFLDDEGNINLTGDLANDTNRTSCTLG